MGLQEMVDEVARQNRETRAQYHLTLGELISDLERTKGTDIVRFDFDGRSPTFSHSYRRYYSDLAFESMKDGDQNVEVSVFLDLCQKCLDRTEIGWKSGEFIMDKDTPLWAAKHGESDGRAIMQVLHDEWLFILVTKEIE